MVDVGDKAATIRSAVASGRVHLGAEAFVLVQANKMKKGDVLTVAQLAGAATARRAHCGAAHRCGHGLLAARRSQCRSACRCSNGVSSATRSRACHWRACIHGCTKTRGSPAAADLINAYQSSLPFAFH
jgi:hypothetical protein